MSQTEIKALVLKLISYSSSFNYCSIHYSNNHPSKYQLIAAFGAKDIIYELDELEAKHGSWMFGYVSYDLKNQFEQLHSTNNNSHQLNDSCFFIPEIVVMVKDNTLTISPVEREQELIQFLNSLTDQPKKCTPIFLQPSTTKQDYLKAVHQLKQHIQQGDIYEVNYCMQYFSENAEINAEDLFLQLNSISEAPFACYTKLDEHVLISSSPERFICKQDEIVFTQPIKGTAPRGKSVEDDELNKNALRENEKEINENVMIVDVSRNDLSRIAKKGTVSVSELFVVKTYKQVHQMESTVTCEIDPNTTIKTIFKATFPPASMTGAPKIRAMQLIDQYENFRRGAYSGSIGFIDPKGNFDFNVVIRSIVYNSKNKFLSYAVGSAITAKCDPEKEYEECLLKASAMEKVLSKQ